MACESRPPIELVLLLLDYEPATGTFYWQVSRGRVKKGSIAGSKDSHGYLRIRINSRSYGAHNLAWLITTGSWSNKLIDHRNGLRDDNRVTNLREIDHVGNAQNVSVLARHNNHSSGLLGVSWSERSKKWHAYIRHSGRKHNLGGFASPEEAHAAYLAAKRIHHQHQPEHNR